MFRAVTNIVIPFNFPQLLVSSSADGSVKLWRYVEGKHLQTVVFERAESVESVKRVSVLEAGRDPSRELKYVLNEKRDSEVIVSALGVCDETNRVFVGIDG